MAITSILSTATSGLRAASVRAESAANNIASVATEGYEASRVLQRSVVGGDGALSGGTAVEAQLIGSDEATDLSREIVNLIDASNAYKANAAAFRTGDETSRALLAVKA